MAARAGPRVVVPPPPSAHFTPRPPPRFPLRSQLPPHNPHQSNAEELVAKVPVIEVAARVALCDGGGGAMGHPIEYVQLDRKDGRSVGTCGYCGLRYKMAAGGHHH